jgi:hypothetical protein
MCLRLNLECIVVYTYATFCGKSVKSTNIVLLNVRPKIHNRHENLSIRHVLSLKQLLSKVYVQC